MRFFEIEFIWLEEDGLVFFKIFEVFVENGKLMLDLSFLKLKSLLE